MCAFVSLGTVWFTRDVISYSAVPSALPTQMSAEQTIYCDSSSLSMNDQPGETITRAVKWGVFLLLRKCTCTIQVYARLWDDWQQ